MCFPVSLAHGLATLLLGTTTVFTVSSDQLKQNRFIFNIDCSKCSSDIQCGMTGQKCARRHWRCSSWCVCVHQRYHHAPCCLSLVCVISIYHQKHLSSRFVIRKNFLYDESGEPLKKIAQKSWIYPIIGTV